MKAILEKRDLVKEINVLFDYVHPELDVMGLCDALNVPYTTYGVSVKLTPEFTAEVAAVQLVHALYATFVGLAYGTVMKAAAGTPFYISGQRPLTKLYWRSLPVFDIEADIMCIRCRAAVSPEPF